MNLVYQTYFDDSNFNALKHIFAITKLTTERKT